jgi:ribonuclease P/MRP protein subunit POP8
MSNDVEMPDISVLPTTQPPSKTQKSHELFTCTIKSPPFAYAHLELVTDTGGSAKLDNLQVRSYCTAALRQFLGEHGVAVAIDILKVAGNECWLRLPRQDLGVFSAAITAFPGSVQNGGTSLLRLLACGDWLGSLVGRADEQKLWNS